MTDRWSYPVAQAMQRHTGSRYVKPKIAPPVVPQEPPPQEQPPVNPAPATTESTPAR